MGELSSQTFGVDRMLYFLARNRRHRDESPKPPLGPVFALLSRASVTSLMSPVKMNIMKMLLLGGKVAHGFASNIFYYITICSTLSIVFIKFIAIFYFEATF